MERKISRILQEWKESGEREAMVVVGSRQIGKTYSIREFGKGFGSYIELNLEDREDHRSLFSGDLSADTIIDRLSFLPGTRIVPGDTLLFIDEIQKVPDAISSLKSLAQRDDILVIASGSLLGLALKGKRAYDEDENGRLPPLGYVRIEMMHSMDFEEFMWAMGVSRRVTDDIRGCIRDHRPMDDFTYRKTRELFSRYSVVGGMPAAVQDYVSGKEYSAIQEDLRQISALFDQDIMQYSGGLDALLLRKCLESVPSQLAGENKRFKYADIEMRNGKGRREYGPSIQWLCDAGLITLCYAMREPRMPLRLHTDTSLFKAYMDDTGILAAALGPDASAIVTGGSRANIGQFAENAVSSALVRSGYKPRYFATSDGRLEIDFVISDGRKVIAIEVKSGRNKRSRSLMKLKEGGYGVSEFIKLADWNVGTDENGIVQMPLFAPSFFDPPAPADIGMTDGIDELNAMHDDEHRVQAHP